MKLSEAINQAFKEDEIAIREVMIIEQKRSWKKGGNLSVGDIARVWGNIIRLQSLLNCKSYTIENVLEEVMASENMRATYQKIIKLADQISVV